MAIKITSAPFQSRKWKSRQHRFDRISRWLVTNLSLLVFSHPQLWPSRNQACRLPWRTMTITSVLWLATTPMTQRGTCRQLNSSQTKCLRQCQWFRQVPSQPTRIKPASTNPNFLRGSAAELRICSMCLTRKKKTTIVTTPLYR